VNPDLARATKAITSLLYGTEATDPIIFAAMRALLCMVALRAGQIPAPPASTHRGPAWRR
jgi:hypothetical protein